MKEMRSICLLMIALFIMLSASSAFSQPDQAPASDKPAQGAVSTAQQDSGADAAQAVKELSIYGEVQAVNESASSMSVQYYDYDTDEEKTAEVVVGKETKMENAAAVTDIKKGDWVDVTYTLTGGKNIAKSVIVEKEEAIPEVAQEKAAAAATPVEE